MNDISVNATHNNATISGLASAVQPSMLGVIAQVLNHAHLYQIPILEDNLIMTGSLIGINPATLGQEIVLDFGELLGEVRYTVNP